MTTHEASSSSSSKSKLWNYDVFLSFSGVDTRNGFTGHLHAALTDRGYQAYIDEDDLERGEEIKEELFRAIKEARISIIVFSKSYADSSWCLDELVKIMECRYKLGRHVLPIFFHVDPSHVRKQNEDLAQAFQKHEEGIREEKDDKERETRQERVKQWRKALTEAANLSGQHLQITDKGREAKLIREIVDNIIPKWLPIAEELHMAKHPVGIYTRIQDIITYLSNGGSDVRMVGIWGMGGLGKTTAAKAIYNKIHHEFQFKSFLDNVSEYDLVDLQGKLVSDILKQTEFKITSVDRGISLIKNHLRRRSVLVIIDNVDKVEQLNAIAGNRDWFGPGSRIIITTRDERLLKQVNMKVDKTYLLKEMNEDEALKLFSWHAFGNSWPNEGYLELSKEVVSYCGGLPLALEVLGSSMIERTPTEWKSQLEKLKKFPDEGIMKPLRVSFERLDPAQKDIFLDISCFFIGWDKDYVAKILDGCKFFATIGINVLCERCLITIEHKKLNMHDLLQEMAKLIISEKSPRHPGEWSRLWNQQEVIDVLRDKFGTEEVKGLALNFSGDHWLQRLRSFSTEAFANMKKLRLLQLYNVQLNGEYKHLSKELIWLRWFGCPLKSIPDHFFDQPRALVILEIAYSRLVQVWEGSKSLGNLKILNLSYCLDLKKSPDFSNLLNLEELILEWCNSLSEIHPSICHLKKLSLVNLTGCQNLISLPGDFYKSKSVQTLVLNGCQQFSELPEDLGKMTSLRVLIASSTAIRQVPCSIVRLKNLTHLSLASVESKFTLQFPNSLDGNLDLSKHYFHTLPSLCGLSKLENLQLSNCCNLHTLPGLSGLSQLKTLELNHCSNLYTLPSLNGLSNLKTLGLSHCSNLHTLPSLNGLSKLKTLGLSRCSNLHSLPSLNGLSKLKTLELSHCSNLHTLPSLNGLSKLKTLELSHCSNLHILPSLNGLSNLKILGLSQCSNLHTLPSLNGLSNLKTLWLSHCSNLHTLPSLNGLSKLKTLELSHCSNLHTLPSLNGLSNLETLELSHCSNLHTLPSLNGLSKLEGMELSHCSNLHTLPSLNGLSNLKTLGLSQCSNLHTLPSLNCLSNLKTLWLSHCSNLHTLPSLNGLSNLKTLELSHCSNLHILPSLNGLSNLKTLGLSHCSNLHILPSLNDLSNLKTLWLSHCSNLHTLPSLNGLSNLKTMWLNHCGNLHTLPCLNGLSNLETLELSHSSNLHTLPSLNGLSNLKTLELSHCSILHTLPSLNGLSKLEGMWLSYCSQLHTIYDLPTNLKFLDAYGCCCLVKMPNFSKMSNMRELNVTGSHALTEIPDLDKSLNSMKWIVMQKCTNLTADFRRKVLKGWTSYGYAGIFLDANYVPDWFEFVNDGDKVSFDTPQVMVVILKG